MMAQLPDPLSLVHRLVCDSPAAVHRGTSACRGRHGNLFCLPKQAESTSQLSRNETGCPERGLEQVITMPAVLI